MSENRLDQIGALLSDAPDHSNDFTYELLLRGAITYCRQDASPEAISLLEACCQLDSFPMVHSQALLELAAIAETGNLDAIDAIFRLALLTPNLAARQLCSTHSWEPSDPSLFAGFQLVNHNIEDLEKFDPDLFFLSDFYINHDKPILRMILSESAKDLGMETWLIIVDVFSQPSIPSLKGLISLFPKCSTQEKGLIVSYLSKLSLTSTDAFDTLCEIAVYYQDKQCINNALTLGLRPSSPQLAAAFLFITSQWEEYEVVDFDHKLLSQFFETSTPQVQYAILAHSRSTGYTQWLDSTHASHLRLMADLTDSDWVPLHQRLLNQKEFEKLFQLALVAPLTWAATILLSLSQTGWNPPDSSQIPAYIELVDQAAFCLAHPPELKRIRGIDMLTTPIAAALYEEKGLLAVSNHASSLEIWQTRHLNLGAQTINLPSPAHQVAFDKSGDYIAAASSDHQIRIYRVIDLRLIKTLSHHSSWIKDLQFSPDNRTLLSSGYDGKVIAYRFPSGPEVSRCTMPYKEVGSLSHSTIDDLWTVTGVSPRVYRFQLPSMRVITDWKTTGSGYRFHSEANQHPILAAATNSGTIELWNPLTARSLVAPFTVDSPLSSLLFNTTDDFLVTSDIQGQIKIYSVPILDIVTAYHTSSGIISAMLDKSGLLFIVHDTGTLELFDTVELQLSRSVSSRQGSPQIPLLKENIPNSPWLQFADLIFKFQHQHDIELGLPGTFHFDEYDILMGE